MIRRWLAVRAATRVTKAAERVRVNDLLAEMDAAMPGRLDRLDGSRGFPTESRLSPQNA